MPERYPERTRTNHIQHTTILFVLAFLFPFLLQAQAIRGIVVENDNRGALSEVKIENIHTGESTISNPYGSFSINATSEQLLMFTKDGYNAVRVRIPTGIIPPYFKIIMSRWYAPQIYEVHDWKYDSTKEYELWKHELEFPRLTGLDVIRSPFSAMDPHNQQIWAFQDMYKENEAEKYVDYMFNKKIVTDLTGLEGDSLNAYMRRYRPSHAQLRAMSEYNFYNYIRTTAAQYRRNANSYQRVSH